MAGQIEFATTAAAQALRAVRRERFVKLLKKLRQAIEERRGLTAGFQLSDQ